MKNAEKKQMLAKRLLDCRIAKGWSQRQAADAMDVALRSVQSWEMAQTLPHPAKIQKISETYNRPIPWFYGDDSTAPRALAAQWQAEGKSHSVPVVSWASAGQGGDFADLSAQIDEYLNSDCQDPNAYALILEGDSMTPEFKSGDRVIFLPNEQPRNGDVVVARLEESGDVLFKLYHTYGPNNEMVRLTSYNPVYPSLEYRRDQFRFIHPMHSLIRYRRR
ncbi:MAG TPA: S24 family peptidase [Verrucomicrobiae bacterium]